MKMSKVSRHEDRWKISRLNIVTENTRRCTVQYTVFQHTVFQIETKSLCNRRKWVKTYIPRDRADVNRARVSCTRRPCVELTLDINSTSSDSRFPMVPLGVFSREFLGNLAKNGTLHDNSQRFLVVQRVNDPKQSWEVEVEVGFT